MTQHGTLSRLHLSHTGLPRTASVPRAETGRLQRPLLWDSRLCKMLLLADGTDPARIEILAHVSLRHTHAPLLWTRGGRLSEAWSRLSTYNPSCFTELQILFSSTLQPALSKRPLIHRVVRRAQVHLEEGGRRHSTTSWPLMRAVYTRLKEDLCGCAPPQRIEAEEMVSVV